MTGLFYHDCPLSKTVGLRFNGLFGPLNLVYSLPKERFDHAKICIDFYRRFFERPNRGVRGFVGLRSLHRQAESSAASRRRAMPPRRRVYGQRSIRRCRFFHRIGRPCHLSLLLLGPAASRRDRRCTRSQWLVRNGLVSLGRLVGFERRDNPRQIDGYSSPRSAWVGTQNFLTGAIT